MSRVQAIIVNYNSWRDTVECLESVCRSTFPDLHVLVLDNGSTDDSVTQLRSWMASQPGCSATLELEALSDNHGFAGANNIGLRRVVAAHDPSVYAWLLNNDTVVAPDALSRMLRVAETDAAIGAVGATLLQYHAPDRIEMAAGGSIGSWHGMVRAIGHDRLRGDAKPLGRLDYVSGTCVLVPKRVLHDVGLMDERYFLYAEDSDWSLRIREAGYRLAYCPEAEVWHKGGASVVHGGPVHDYYVVKSTLLFVHKRSPALLPLAVAYSLARCVLPKFLRGDWRRLRPVRRAYIDFFRQVSTDAAVPIPRTV